MKVDTLVAASVATPTSKAFGLLSDIDSSNLVVVQVVLSSTGSVQMQGSLDGVNYASLGSAITTSSIVTVTKTPWIRAVVGSNAGTCSVFIAG